MPEQVFRHRNGSGRVIGILPAVGNDCLLDNTSLVEGRTRVSWGSRIRNESAVKDSEVVISTLDRTIAIGSHIAFAQISDSLLIETIVRGAERPAEVSNCVLGQGVVIEGCQVSGFELAGPHWLHEDWTRAPRTFFFNEPGGPRLALTECTEGRAHCGCVCRPIKEWIEKKELLRRLFMKRHNWQGDQVNLIHEFFLDWKT